MIDASGALFYSSMQKKTDPAKISSIQISRYMHDIKPAIQPVWQPVGKTGCSNRKCLFTKRNQQLSQPVVPPVLHLPTGSTIATLVNDMLLRSIYTINYAILYIIFPIVGLYALTLYPARADCVAATDISGDTGCWQLSR